jgi:hypothetical protein
VDITCDSDGQVNKFIDLRDVRDTLPLHKLNTNGNGLPEPYYLGFFLMGAYQDIMGDLHNLFGRVNEVHVFLEPDEPAGYYIEEIIEGTTIVQSLASVQYDENELKRQMKAQMDEAIKSDRMKPSEAMRLLDDYERGLKAYTYLSFCRTFVFRRRVCGPAARPAPARCAWLAFRLASGFWFLGTDPFRADAAGNDHGAHLENQGSHPRQRFQLKMKTSALSALGRRTALPPISWLMQTALTRPKLISPAAGSPPM